MHCPHCGQEHPDGIIFCPLTGRKIVKETTFCMNCGAKLEASWKICPQCGVPVGEVLRTVRAGEQLHEQALPESKKPVNLRGLALLGSLVFITILVTAYFFLVRRPPAVPTIEVSQPTLTPSENQPTTTPPLGETPTDILLPTSSPPLAGVEFPLGTVEYPEDWPIELRYPEEFNLVETSSGSLDPGAPKGWAAKLRFEGDVKRAADLLSSFFTENGWQVSERTDLDSGGILIMIERNAGANQGILVIDLDLTDPAYTNVLATVFP